MNVFDSCGYSGKDFVGWFRSEKDRDRHIERAEVKEKTSQRELSNVDARGSKTYACCLVLSVYLIIRYNHTANDTIAM